MKHWGSYGGVPPWPSGLYSGLVLSLWRKALVRVTAAPPSYVFPLLELSDLTLITGYVIRCG